MTNPGEENNTSVLLGTTQTDAIASSITASSSSSTAAVMGGGEKTTSGVAPDEDFSKEYEPVVRLAEVETKTGEEEEEVVFKIRAKLFRFSKELREWKERGTGDIRILKHRVNEKIRLLMRREKTLKICLNHYVSPSVELTENVGSDRSWVWHGIDYADGERDEALLAIRFRDSDYASQFKEAYDNAREEMRKLVAVSSTSEKDGDDDVDDDGDNDDGTEEEEDQETKKEETENGDKDAKENGDDVKKEETA